MDHVVYVDTKARELETLLGGEKTMIVRGGTVLAGAQRRMVGEPDPDAGHQLRVVAREPRVRRIVGGAGRGERQAVQAEVHEDARH